ncbi:MAG: CHAT domain-containing protein [Deltaproteobacteria bacterium]|nr:CHAT domain-containing protein [Deltaproteobacteria bacterium]MBW2418059.1 CHAT domain-containing protein [Deltaproteobacteria bacterium]
MSQAQVPWAGAARIYSRACRSLVVLAAALINVAAASAQSPAPAEICETPAATAEEISEEQKAAAALARGNTLEGEGQYPAALSAYEESGRLARESGDRRLALLADANAARAALQANRSDGVASQLERVVAAAGELPEAGARAQLLIHAGRSYALLASREEGAGKRSALRRAAEAFGRAREEAEKAGDERLRSYALGYLAELYELRGRQEDAAELTRRAILAAQSADAPDALYRWQWRLARLEIAAGRVDRGLGAYRDAVATLRDVRAQTALASAQEGALQRRIESLYREFVDLLLQRSARSQAPSEQQTLLVEARDALEDLKASELRDYFRDPCLDAQRKATPDTIPNTIVLYPVLLQSRVVMIVSQGGRLEQVDLGVDRETLTAEIRDFRRLLEKRTSRRYRPLAEKLYERLIRPVEPTFRGADESTTLVFVPDGALRTIPFGVLRDAKSKQFLIEKHPIAVTPSLTLTDPRPIESGGVRVLAAGISEAVGGYPELDSVVVEIEAIEKMYGAKALMNEEFSADKLQSELTNVPFGIVHIASHGEFGGDPSENFLLAYDGRLSMERLANAVAATRFRADQPLELLTLSACESAAGNDRAALGLAGVAIRSGARSALATLWSVNDEATTELILEFYGQLSQGGHSRAEALQIAQVKMLSTRHYRHPGYWAPFLLINSWL